MKFNLRASLLVLTCFVAGIAATVAYSWLWGPFPHDVFARVEAFEPDQQDWFYQHTSEVYPTRTVSRSETGQQLPLHENMLTDFTYHYQAKELTFTDFYHDLPTSGLVILHQGKIVHESYARGADSGTRFLTFSVAKSFTSTLIGICVQEGLIDNVESPLIRYLPELEGTAYEEVTIRQALEMSSGVRYDVDSPDNINDTIDFITKGTILGKQSAYELAIAFPSIAEPGTTFNYNTAETQVLLELIRRVSGLSVSKYMEQKLWRPLGMTHDAAWVIDHPGPSGVEVGGAFFTSTLRDWARFGWFIAQDGQWEGNAILPADWVNRASKSSAPHLQTGKVHPNTLLGYGWQWWNYPDGTFAAKGSNGQSIFIDRQNEIVIAIASSWEESWVAEYSKHTEALYSSVQDSLTLTQ